MIDLDEARIQPVKHGMQGKPILSKSWDKVASNVDDGDYKRI